MNEDLKNKILKDFDEFKADLLIEYNGRYGEFDDKLYSLLYHSSLKNDINKNDLIKLGKYLSDNNVEWPIKALYDIFDTIVGSIYNNSNEECLENCVNYNKSDLLRELIEDKLISDSYKTFLIDTPDSLNIDGFKS